MKYALEINIHDITCAADMGIAIRKLVLAHTGIRMSDGMALSFGNAYYKDRHRNVLTLSPTTHYKKQHQHVITQSGYKPHPVATSLFEMDRTPAVIALSDTSHQLRSITEPPPTKPIDRALLSRLPRRSAPITQAPKSFPLHMDHQQLLKDVTELRAKSLMSASPVGEDRVGIRRGHTKKLFFSRVHTAAVKHGKTAFIADWSNLVVIKNLKNESQAAYLYDGRGGLTVDAFSYGLSHHSVVASGAIKISMHKISESLSIPHLIFCPDELADGSGDGLAAYNLIIYVISTLAAPVRLSIVDDTLAQPTNSHYYYGAIMADADKDHAYTKITETLRECERKRLEPLSSHELAAEQAQQERHSLAASMLGALLPHEDDYDQEALSLVS
ncbi:MAG: hypothetical protein COB66_03265 [Coxiella sp. (in: Bacteria)]|nr:MAG: hypothetical protein COB66_03265 [Coxiella sp. (in: g-proteobacteria)]